MQNISQKSQNLSKISGFQNFAKLRFCITSTIEKLYITRLILKIQELYFTCMLNFYSRKASRSKDHFLIGWKIICSKKIFWVHLFRGPVAFAQLGFGKENFLRVLAITVPEQSQKWWGGAYEVPPMEDRVIKTLSHIFFNQFVLHFKWN